MDDAPSARSHPETLAGGSDPQVRVSLGIGIAQFGPTDDASANVARITELARLAVARGAAIVVFPEYSSWFTPQAGPEWVAGAQAADGPFVTALAALADELDVHLVAGFLETTDEPDRVFNTVIAVAPHEGIVARYRKLHLYDAFGQLESDWVRPGTIEEPATFTVGGVRFGIQTCYDIRFPEVTRRIVDAGADVVCVPAEWVRGPLKEHHWRVLSTARAIENTAYVVAADHSPPIGVGNSMVLDPMGVELATIGDTDGVAVGWLESSRVAEVRRVNPALALRRFSVVPR